MGEVRLSYKEVKVSFLAYIAAVVLFESSLLMSIESHVSHDVPTIQRVEGNPVI